MARVAGKKRRKLVARLVARDGAACVWCSKKLSSKQATVEHVIPYKHGGSNAIENMVIACETCNWERGTVKASKFARRCKARGLELREEVLADAFARLSLPHVRRATLLSVQCHATKQERREASLRLERTRARHARTLARQRALADSTVACPAPAAA